MGKTWGIKQELSTELTTSYFLWRLTQDAKISMSFSPYTLGNYNQNLGFEVGLTLSYSDKGDVPLIPETPLTDWIGTATDIQGFSPCDPGGREGGRE